MCQIIPFSCGVSSSLNRFCKTQKKREKKCLSAICITEKKVRMLAPPDKLRSGFSMMALLHIYSYVEKKIKISYDEFF